MDATPCKLAEDPPVVVLLVDDQAMVGEAVRRALAGHPDIIFHYCRDPAEAIATAESVKATIILQDLVMPGIDGLTLVRRFRTNLLTANTPIIVLSTKEDPKVKSEAFAAGASDYLVKLPDAIELVARLRHHSNAFVLRAQRDAAHRALGESQRQLVETNLELQRLTNVDGLTGLSNRRYFDEFIVMQWKLALREQSELSVLMIDVDNFKLYNDTYGHLGGDEVLKRIAQTMRSNFRRPTDFAGRFGGEEFVVVLAATAAQDAHALGIELCSQVADLQISNGEPRPFTHVTVSIGGSSAIPRPGESVLLLIETADKALYEAKQLGKNRVVMRPMPRESK